MLAFRFLATVTARSAGQDADFMPQQEPAYLTGEEVMAKFRALAESGKARK